MKNLKILALGVLLISLTLTGCGKKAAEKTGNPEENTTENVNQMVESDNEKMDEQDSDNNLLDDAKDDLKEKSEDKEDKEMAENFSEDDKKMMAGKNNEDADSKGAGSEAAGDNKEKAAENNDNVVNINGFDIEIMPDKAMNTQKDGVKYGELKHVIYPSKTCEKDRPMNIMLPADYSTDKKYPVLYVLHGIFGDEYSMCGDGKSGVPALIDNLMAEGEAEEMIVVYPHMFASKDKDQCTAIDDENVAPYDNFVNELVNDIMPYMSENYSILEGKENTAITGFSMGGRESLAIGIMRPDLFGYVGAVAPAPGLVPGKDMYLQHKGQFEEDEITYKDEKPFFIMICAGDKDSVVGKFPKEYHELYEKNGIEHTWWEIPGSDHGDPAISSGIGNFVRYIFK